MREMWYGTYSSPYKKLHHQLKQHCIVRVRESGKVREKEKEKGINETRAKLPKTLNNLTSNIFVSIVPRQTIRPKTAHNHSPKKLGKSKQHGGRKGRSKARGRGKYPQARDQRKMQAALQLRYLPFTSLIYTLLPPHSHLLLLSKAGHIYVSMKITMG